MPTEHSTSPRALGDPEILEQFLVLGKETLFQAGSEDFLGDSWNALRIPARRSKVLTVTVG